MRFVLILGVLVGLLWWLSARRGSEQRPPKPKQGGSESPQPMLACALCGVHLPRDEALPGRGGVFCSEAHRKTFEQAHPDS
jgi:uncharacterized protein